MPSSPISETYQDQGVAFVGFSYWSQSSKTLNPTVLEPGERLELIYRIASETEMAVWLAASILHEQHEYYSAGQDVEVALETGVHSYKRKFTVHPSWPVGAYSLEVSVLQKPSSRASTRLAVWKYPRPILIF